MVTLEPITSDNLNAICNLRVRDDQQGFVAPNVRSIAQAYVDPDVTPLGVFADGEPVGFVMIGREKETGRDWVIRLMVDATQQGKGYGRAALEAAVARLREGPGASDIYLSYVPGNEHAERLYQVVGFESTGEIEDEEIVMRLRKE